MILGASAHFTVLDRVIVSTASLISPISCFPAQKKALARQSGQGLNGPPRGAGGGCERSAGMELCLVVSVPRGADHESCRTISHSGIGQIGPRLHKRWTLTRRPVQARPGPGLDRSRAEPALYPLRFDAGQLFDPATRHVAALHRTAKAQARRDPFNLFARRGFDWTDRYLAIAGDYCGGAGACLTRCAPP
jgi:hypothetical protein